MSEKKPSPPHQNDPNLRNQGGNWFSRGWFWIVLIILLVIGSRYLFSSTGDAANLVGLNRVASYVQEGKVKTITVQGDNVVVVLNDTTKLQTRKENDESLLQTLRAFGVSEETLQSLSIEVESAPNSGAIFSWLMMLLPMLLIFGFFIFIMRQAGGGGQNRAMQFGRSRARKMEGADRPTVTFSDVAGSDEAKQELAEVVEFLKEPQKFAALGARIPKGVLLVGPPLQRHDQVEQVERGLEHLALGRGVQAHVVAPKGPVDRRPERVGLLDVVGQPGRYGFALARHLLGLGRVARQREPHHRVARGDRQGFVAGLLSVEDQPPRGIVHVRPPHIY